MGVKKKQTFSVEEVISLLNRFTHPCWVVQNGLTVCGNDCGLTYVNNDQHDISPNSIIYYKGKKHVIKSHILTPESNLIFNELVPTYDDDLILERCSLNIHEALRMARR